MDSAWEEQPDSPAVKYEATNVDSFLSPPPQFPSTSDTTASDALAAYTLTPGLPASPSPAPAPEAEKKPVKKRKSWGQVLPEPKTNLPPRKRAKTEDEKEQRRVERVLRNRRAAQSSRERKRQEVEALERRTKDLEAMLLNAQRVNGILIAHIRNTEGSLPPDLTATKPLPTLGNSIFQSPPTEPLDGSVSDLASFDQETLTVDPASLSPIPEEATTTNLESDVSDPASELLTAPAASSVDSTQRPAVSVDGAAAVMASSSEPAPSDPFGSTMPDFDFLRHFDDAGSGNPDSYFLENGMLSSPEPSLIADDDLVRDASFAPTDLNFNEYLHDEFSRGWPDGAGGSLSSVADSDPLFGLANLPEPETQVS